MTRFTIKGRLKGLNDYTYACRSKSYAGSSMKRREEEKVMWSMLGVKERYTGAVFITFKWYEPNKRRDKDNIAFAKKFILDAMVKKGVIAKDSWQGVEGFRDEFFIDSENPRIEVEIKGVGEWQ